MPKAPERPGNRAEIAQQIIQALPQAHSYVLALSGGGDSVAMLKLLAGRIPLRCAHVNHGLGPQADSMQQAAETMAARFDCGLRCFALSDAPSSNVESWARERRYAALQSCLQPGEVLITAQHRDDQAETFLLAAARASGPAGLRAMVPLQPFGGGWLARPALALSRVQLQAVLEPTDVWVEDPGNQDARFDRNRLRHTVMPALAAWKPEAVPNMARAAAQWAQTQESWGALLDAYAEEIAGGIAHAWRAQALLSLPAEVRDMFLRRMVAQAGGPTPPSALLRELPVQVANARQDAETCLEWRGWSLRLYRKRLYLLPPLPAAVGDMELAAKASMRWPAGGQIQLESSLDSPTWVVAGRNGVQLPMRDGHHKALQKVFQELGVPAWVRPFWPQLLRAGEVVGVAELSHSWPTDVSKFHWLQPPWWIQPWLERARARAFR